VNKKYIQSGRRTQDHPPNDPCSYPNHQATDTYTLIDEYVLYVTWIRFQIQISQKKLAGTTTSWGVTKYPVSAEISEISSEKKSLILSNVSMPDRSGRNA
jgi:hypothetical protein